MLHRVYFSLGANLGNRKQTLGRAIEWLAKLVGPVERQSSYHETAPWGVSSPHPFLNAAVCCSTTLTPRQVLCVTQKIELLLGRRQKSTDGSYHDRPIDIDILLYDDLCIDEPDLKIPHPLMHEREFVMKPLNEIR